MHLQCRPELGPPPYLRADPCNVAAALVQRALARPGPQPEHEEVDVGRREAVAQDIGAFPPEPLVDDVEQAVRLRIASPAQHGEGLLALDQRTTVKGKIDGRIDIAAHEGEPGEKNAVVVAAGRWC